MRARLTILGLVSTAILITNGLAQTPPALPPRIDPPRGAIVPNTPARQERDLERRMRDMRTLESRMRIQDQVDRRILNPPSYTSEQITEIKKRRKVDERYLKDYSTFLQSKDTGIFKLFPDIGCFSATVLSIEERCKNSLPASSGFSFRNHGYADELYHDIYYKGETLGSYAFFAQGIFLALGPFPIEGLNAENEAVASMSSLVADVSAEDAIKNVKRYRQGIAVGKYRFADRVVLEPGGTYLLRNICYQNGNSFAQPNGSSTMTELKFLSLSLDKRSDAIVAFKVVEIDVQGGVTLVWKLLSSREAPELKFRKGSPPRDLREPGRDN